MCPHVFLERTGMGARIVALFTVERLFSGMSEYVSLKDSRLCTGEFTMCAIVRLFPCMCSLVCLQMASIGARVVTVCATERFFHC